MPSVNRQISWTAWGLLAVLAVGLLIRNILAIPALAPLDPNEGWNAAHALSLLANRPLYPPANSLMVNNYPPLFFYCVGKLTLLTGDAVIAGRILSSLSFLLVCAGIVQTLRRMGCGTWAQLCAMVFFAAVLLIGSDYVGMADPQLLGHVAQLAALLLLLRGRIVWAGAAFALSLFVKHNLLALPLAAAAWLLWRDRRAALSFMTSGAAFAAFGLILFHQVYGLSLPAQLMSPRLVSWANLQRAVSQLWWAVLPLGLLAAAKNPRKDFCRIYAIASLAIGLAFCAGDGVDANAFFDLAIACALTLGLEIEQRGAPLFSALCAIPLSLFLILNFHDNNFFFTQDFRAESARDIAFLKSQPGPALCDQFSLCLWAGKGAQVDVFNVGEQIKTGARNPSSLAAMIAGQHFGVLQLQDLDAMGPVVRAAIAQNYRLHHANDNGSFLVPLTRAP
jgi:hypothetical protein